MTLTGSTSIITDRGLIAFADAQLSNSGAKSSTRVGVFPACCLERRIVFSDARQHHRRAVGEFSHQRPVPAHGLDGLPDGAQQEIAAFFEARDAVLGDPARLGHADLGKLAGASQPREGQAGKPR